MRKFILLSFLFIIGVGLTAQDIPSAPQNYTPVFDQAEMFSSEAEQKVSQLLQQHFDQKGNQIQVATIKSLKGYAIEEYADKWFNEWGIGQKGRDNGALLLVVKNNRKVRIEVGYGLEEALTDNFCARIIDRIISPNFKEQAYDVGLEEAVNALVGKLRGKRVDFKKIEETQKKRIKAIKAQKRRQRNYNLLMGVGIYGFILAFFVYFVGKNRKGERNSRNPYVALLYGGLLISVFLGTLIVAPLFWILSFFYELELLDIRILIGIALAVVIFVLYFCKKLIIKDFVESSNLFDASSSSSSSSSSYSDSSSSSYKDYSDYTDYGGGSSGGGGASGGW